MRQIDQLSDYYGYTPPRPTIGQALVLPDDWSSLPEEIPVVHIPKQYRDDQSENIPKRIGWQHSRRNGLSLQPIEKEGRDAQR